MDFQEIEPYASDSTLRMVNERIKQATDSIFGRVEELCALLADRTELKRTGNSEASASTRANASASPSPNRHDRLLPVNSGIQLLWREIQELPGSRTMGIASNKQYDMIYTTAANIFMTQVNY